ncbi:MAG: hypothetical protein QM723_18510 [Myxococcaceae bacterium]
MTTTNKAHNVSASHPAHTTHTTATHAATRSTMTSTHLVGPIDVAHPPAGMNPALAPHVRAMHVLTDPALQPSHGVTHCNQAANKYAQSFGYNGFNGLNADQINHLMSNPRSGWHRVSEADAIKAAQAGKLTMESVPASARHAHGHIAPVVGEWSPGKAGIAQAGTDNYEWGSWRRETPQFFVRD